MASQSDAMFADLLTRSRAGKADAQGVLLERYRNYLSLLCRLQLGARLQGKMDASDVVQDAFLEAHRHFAVFRGQTEQELLAWLRQILAGRLANLVRHYDRRKRDVKLERRMAIDIDNSSRMLDRGLFAPGSSPSQHVAHQEQAVLLADALAKLPEHYREVIILSHVESLSYADIAIRMERTVDSVKNLWARALGHLRRELGAQS